MPYHRGHQATSLETHSPAYVAYKTLDRLPKNAPAFELNENGYPIVHSNERYCRLANPTTGSLRGRVTNDKANLLKHLDNFHGMERKYRIPSGNNRTKAVVRKNAKFPEELMRDDFYEKNPSNGERTGNVPSQGGVARARSQSNVIAIAGHGGGVDDEEALPQQNDNGAAVNTETSTDKNGDQGTLQNGTHPSINTPSTEANSDSVRLPSDGDIRTNQRIDVIDETRRFLCVDTPRQEGIRPTDATEVFQQAHISEYSEDEVLELQRVKSEHSLRLAKLKRKEATFEREEVEAELRLLEVEEKLAMRKKVRRG